MELFLLPRMNVFREKRRVFCLEKCWNLSIFLYEEVAIGAHRMHSFLILWLCAKSSKLICRICRNGIIHGRTNLIIYLKIRVRVFPSYIEYIQITRLINNDLIL